MCRHGIKATQVRLAKPRSDGRTHAPVDPCIAPLVQTLNDGGFLTINSCCGHGHRPGWIALADGRHLSIHADLAELRRLDKIWPKDIHGIPLEGEQP